MMQDYVFTVTERFCRYVTIDTTSDPNSNTYPSTPKQKDLAKLLGKELHELGLHPIVDEFGYVYACLPANTKKSFTPIAFIAHIDTTSDCSGTGVKPIIHRSYHGQDIVLPDDHNQVLSPRDMPYLLTHLDKDIITASGKTLLGADDKSGLAVIVDMVHYFYIHPDIEHGDIFIVFTPDEEIARGTAKIDMDKIKAQYAYTLDGGALGTIEDECFNARALTLTIKGVSFHPGAAKDRLINPIKLAARIIDELPAQLAPEHTEGRQGFIHPHKIEGSATDCQIHFLLRDFDVRQLTVYEDLIRLTTEEVLKKYQSAGYHIAITEQYKNMKIVLDQHPQVMKLAEDACKKALVPVKNKLIRGGTDGSLLSFMGLPTANIFTGQQAIHSCKEWIGVEDMKSAVKVLVALVQLYVAE
ncbi:MAG: peptidase T [Phycisphaerales bacterium]|nr:peptidase T [Phycisphaerales bacterium]